jgi:probable F420-dependent oxidoreductase
MLYEHVLGADTSTRPGWSGWYALEDAFHEALVVLGYLCAVTERLRLVTGILILPQRQTALVAKQAAEVDLLSGGRLTLGVGVGWNRVEFEALGEDFSTRGRRCDEQIEVLRALWTSPSVDFHGRFHRIPAAGINPLPIQRPIPIWIGGEAEATLERVGRLGDGWIPMLGPEESGAKLERIRRYASAAGRDSAAIELCGTPELAGRTTEEVLALVERWRRAGASHVYFDTMKAGLVGVDAHIDAIAALAPRLPR